MLIIKNVENIKNSEILKVTDHHAKEITYWHIFFQVFFPYTFKEHSGDQITYKK